MSASATSMLVAEVSASASANASALSIGRGVWLWSLEALRAVLLYFISMGNERHFKRTRRRIHMLCRALALAACRQRSLLAIRSAEPLADVASSGSLWGQCLSLSCCLV